MSEWSVRALLPADAAAVRARLSERFGGTHYAARILEQLEAAIRGNDPEYRAMVARDDGHVRALALFGTVAGAQGVSKLHALFGDEHDALQAVALAVRDACDQAGQRMIVCEIADDAPFREAAAVVRESGYVEEGRVADFVRAGVDLLVLVWRTPRVREGPLRDSRRRSR